MHEIVISPTGRTAPAAADWLPTWDGADYAANTGHHRAHDAWFFEHFPVRAGDRLLDLGCGAGDLTALVAAMVPDGHVLGVDPQPTMLDEAGHVALPNQSFRLGTAQRIAEAAGSDAPFDGAYSRATLHWVPWTDHPSIVEQLAALVRPGGWVRIEMGGHGNVALVAEVVGAISAAHGGGPAPWAFPDAAQYLELFERAGLDATGAAPRDETQPAGYVHTVAQRRPFTRETLAGWLSSQCVEAFRPSLPEDAYESFRAEVFSGIDRLRRHDGSFDQTFVRLDALAYRV